MGVSIDMHVFKVIDLIADIEKQLDKEKIEIPEDKLGPEELLELIMPKFGMVIGDKFYILWNEYYEEYNSASEILTFIRRYYQLEDFWSSSYKFARVNNNADEVADELKIELPETSEVW
jgi:hypothetical protein